MEGDTEMPTRTQTEFEQTEATFDVIAVTDGDRTAFVDTGHPAEQAVLVSDTVVVLEDAR